MGLGAVLPLRLIVTERFDAISKIGSVRIPILILEGGADRPLMARRLYDAAQEPKQLADVSTMPLRRGRFRRVGDNCELRLGSLRPHLSNRVEHLFLRDVSQVG
jgi:hypothetical protein